MISWRVGCLDLVWLPGLGLVKPRTWATRDCYSRTRAGQRTAAWLVVVTRPHPGVALCSSPPSTSCCRGSPTCCHRQQNQAQAQLSRHQVTRSTDNAATGPLSPTHHPVIGRQSAHAAADSIYPAAQPVNDALCLAASHRARQWAAAVQFARCLANIARGEDFYQMCRNEDDKKMTECEDIKTALTRSG